MNNGTRAARVCAGVRQSQQYWLAVHADGINFDSLWRYKRTPGDARNLHDAHHLEWVDGPAPTEIGRGAFVTLIVRR